MATHYHHDLPLTFHLGRRSVSQILVAVYQTEHLLHHH